MQILVNVWCDCFSVAKDKQTNKMLDFLFYVCSAQMYHLHFVTIEMRFFFLNVRLLWKNCTTHTSHYKISIASNVCSSPIYYYYHHNSMVSIQPIRIGLITNDNINNTIRVHLILNSNFQCYSNTRTKHIFKMHTYLQPASKRNSSG